MKRTSLRVELAMAEKFARATAAITAVTSSKFSPRQKRTDAVTITTLVGARQAAHYSVTVTR